MGQLLRDEELHKAAHLQRNRELELALLPSDANPYAAAHLNLPPPTHYVERAKPTYARRKGRNGSPSSVSSTPQRFSVSEGKEVEYNASSARATALHSQEKKTL